MRTGCGAWRTVLAFSFVAMILYLLSGLLVSHHCWGTPFDVQGVLSLVLGNLLDFGVRAA